MNIGVISYSLASLFFLMLTLLLLTSWRGRLQGGLMVFAAAVTTIWAGVAAYSAGSLGANSDTYHTFEILRNIVWFIFLLRLLDPLKDPQKSAGSRTLHYSLPFVLLFSLIILIIDVSPDAVPEILSPLSSVDSPILGHLILSIIGLALVEHLFRNTRPDRRWAVKFLFLGIGALFMYDFFLYSNALLFKRIDSDLWQARGFVNIFVVPMVAISAARNPEWSIKVFVSRNVVFHSATLLGAGTYLLVMAAVGYYIRIFGEDWGVVAQTVFLFLSAILLIALLFSGQMRARVKVFLNKHFFSYKYDYRGEWLQLIQTLSQGEPGPQIRERCIQAIASIVDSTGGVLWLKGEGGFFRCIEHWKMPHVHAIEPANGSLPCFLRERDWVISLIEYERQPELYEGLELPAWLREMPRAWLVVPLWHHEELLGFLVLALSQSPRNINWEDRDLLKTAGRQAAGYLALLQASEALAQARQFEAFNRLSAFVVHDLKNLVAQLGLVVSNASKHKDNPAFLEDAICTVENAVAKMNRLLAQLRKGRFEQNNANVIPLAELLKDVVAVRSAYKPAPTLKIEAEDVKIVADRDRFSAVISHLVQNAQEATEADGEIEVRLKQHDTAAIIEVEDSGCGMDPQFVKDHLFRAFDTTKGNAGMGVGVYESREFVSSIGGRIDVFSQPNVGTLFTIYLPMHQANISEHAGLQHESEEVTH